MFDVIEHLDNPNDTLREINRVLKQDGILVLSTGDVESCIAKENLGQWKMIAPPWHLFYFSKSTINKIVTKNGFKTIRIKTRGLITKRKMLNNKAFNYIGNLLKKGDVMTVYFKKCN